MQNVLVRTSDDAGIPVHGDADIIWGLSTAQERIFPVASVSWLGHSGWFFEGKEEGIRALDVARHAGLAPAASFAVGSPVPSPSPAPAPPLGAPSGVVPPLSLPTARPSPVPASPVISVTTHGGPSALTVRASPAAIQSGALAASPVGGAVHLSPVTAPPDSQTSSPGTPSPLDISPALPFPPTPSGGEDIEMAPVTGPGPSTSVPRHSTRRATRRTAAKPTPSAPAGRAPVPVARPPPTQPRVGSSRVVAAGSEAGGERRTKGKALLLMNKEDHPPGWKTVCGFILSSS